MILAARALAVALAVAAAWPAAAADPAAEVAEARARFQRGSELYGRGRYREAIAEFEAAYRIRPHGTIHFNVARCREKLGEWPQALRSYHDYLRETPGAEDRARVLATMRRIEDRLAAAGVQALLVSSEPRGAEVAVDGRPRGTTPFVIALPPGSYAVTLKLEGHAFAARQVDLSLEARAVVDVTLRAGPEASPGALAAPGSAALPAERPPVPGAAPPPGTPPEAVARPDLSAPPPAPDPAGLAVPVAPPPSPEKRRVWTWVAAGATVAAAGAGAYYGMAARQKSDELRDGTYRPAADANALAEDAKAAQRNANVLYGIAAGAAAAGVTLFLVEGRF
jgi:tetratricopeptide (TPR) repeat protein